jgi:hypothetical protein
MSALKAAVEYLAVHDSQQTWELAWRLMNELADDTSLGTPPPAQEGEQA